MWIYISASSKICPLKKVKYYLALSKISENSEEFIFRGLSRGRKFSLRTKNKPISYSRIRENFIKVLKAVNLDWRKYGLHSLRSGGASLAAFNGVSDRLFKRHGRWKSDRAKDGYIEDSLESLLSVSKNLTTWYSSIAHTLRYTRTRLYWQKTFVFLYYPAVYENK